MPSPNPDANIAIGSTLVEKYRVTKEIGRGGMAAVYECEHLQLGKKVAVKVLAAELASSHIVTERFFREARAAASVRSPYIVDVYDSGRLEDGRPFIAMEYLEGESLYDRMARIRLIDAVTTVRVISQCAKGLMKAHAAGIVHRDLKPENIFLTTTEEGEEIAKILDFGLAKFYAPVKPDEQAARLTREGAVFGTPAYMSPEQVRGQGTVDHRSDLWALGCITYECLTGRPVWNTEQGVAMTFAAIAASPIPVPSTIRSDLPLAFDEWFAKALAREPEHRFTSARELAATLARALNAAPISLINVNQAQVDLEAVANLAEELPSESVQLIESIIPPPVGQAPAAPASGRALPDSRRSPPTPRVPVDSSSSTTAGSLSDAVRARAMAPSAVDLPPTTSPEVVTLPPRRSSLGLSYALSSVALAASGALAFMVWSKMLAPRLSPPVIRGTAPSASAQPSLLPPVIPPQEDPKWFAPLAEAQEALTHGDVEAALRKLKDAQEAGGTTVAKSLTEQLRVIPGVPGMCRVVGLSHPRLGTAGSAGRPSIAATTKGAIITWTDDHEQSNHDHAYSVNIEPSGHVVSKVRDLTPEADNVMRPSLAAFEDRVALLYADRSGREAGIRARWLDSEGRIDGASVQVGPAHAGALWPAFQTAPDGFFVVWQDDRDKGHEDLFFRHLSKELTADGPEVRATDYGNDKAHIGRVGASSVAVSQTSLFIAFPLERDRQHLISRMRLALDAPEMKAGLEPKAGSATLADKRPPPSELGDVVVLNDDHVPGDFPSMECVKDGCFVAWHEIGHGAHAAMIDPQKGLLRWRKRFTPSGGHPSIAVNSDGQAQVVYFEGGRVRVAALSRDGVGPGTIIGRVSNEAAPRGWITSGHAKGEWYVAWLDQEGGHAEPFAARIACRN